MLRSLSGLIVMLIGGVISSGAAMANADQCPSEFDIQFTDKRYSADLSIERFALSHVVHGNNERTISTSCDARPNELFVQIPNEFQGVVTIIPETDRAVPFNFRVNQNADDERTYTLVGAPPQYCDEKDALGMIKDIRRRGSRPTFTDLVVLSHLVKFCISKPKYAKTYESALDLYEVVFERVVL